MNLPICSRCSSPAVAQFIETADRPEERLCLIHSVERTAPAIFEAAMPELGEPEPLDFSRGLAPVGRPW